VIDEEPKDTHPNAGRASGYKDGSGNDVGENLVNRVTELMLGPQTKMILLAEQLNAQSATQDRRFEYLLAQLQSHLDKEDARHDALARSETSSLAALTSVARRLDEITSYVQQSVTLAREGIAIGKQALLVGQEAHATGIEALEVGRKAHATGLEALAVGRKALGVSESNAKRLAQVEKRFAEVENTVKALTKGQAASKEQIEKFAADITDLRNEIAELRAQAKEAARLAEQHARLTAQTEEHEKRLREIEAWREALEARDDGK
jgi:uncharacterized coiled-coil protein SlyX